MPYILLVFGLIGGVYAFYRYFIGASVAEIKIVFRNIFLLLFGGILLFFAMTGRMIISIALVVLAIPIAISWVRNKAEKPKCLPKPDDIIENESEENDD